MKTNCYLGILLLSAVILSCGRESGSKSIIIKNNGDTDLICGTVGVDMRGFDNGLAERFVVRDNDGKDITYQICADSTLLMLVDIPAHSQREFRIMSAERNPDFDDTVYGRLYPERCDDLSWENDLVGFRVYGPGTQAKGEKAFGYDLFFKYPESGLVVEKLYEPETDPRTWEIVDSLRSIDPALADDYISTFSYHIDHGLGMDCYPCGPTLGAGVCAVTDSLGDIIYPWCYDTAEIIENGPLRFKVHLTFRPIKIGMSDSVVEHRVITLDAGNYLNDTKVWYDNLDRPVDYVIGFPRRDDSAAIVDSIAGYMAYVDPTDRQPGHEAMLGLVFDKKMRNYREGEGHILAGGTLPVGDTVSYHWGFSWPKSEISTTEDWSEYLEKYKDRRKDIEIIIEQ